MKSVRIGRSGMIQLQNKAIDDNDLLTWTIYSHPEDFPDCYIVRPFSSRLACPLTVHFQHTSLDRVRGALERLGLTCISRAPGDPPSVVETWL